MIISHQEKKVNSIIILCRIICYLIFVQFGSYFLIGRHEIPLLVCLKNVFCQNSLIFAETIVATSDAYTTH